MQAHPDEAEDSDRTPDARSQGLPPPGQRAPREAVDRQQQQALEDERAAWQRQREEFEQERAQSSASQYATARSVSSASTQAALSAARQAAGSRAPSTAPTPANVHRGDNLAFATSPPPQAQPAPSRHEQHQEALRRQAEEIQRRKERQERAREQQQAAAMTSPQPTEPHPSSSTPAGAVTRAALPTSNTVRQLPKRPFFARAGAPPPLCAARAQRALKLWHFDSNTTLLWLSQHSPPLPLLPLSPLLPPSLSPFPPVRGGRWGRRGAVSTR